MYIEQDVRRPQRDHADTLSHNTTIPKATGSGEEAYWTMRGCREAGLRVSDRLRNYRNGFTKQEAASE